LHPDTTDEEDPRSSFTFVKAKNIETIEGLGFLENEIIDQHFVARKRHNRLLSMALEHPRLLGIGIDESTAIEVKPDRTFEVMGEGTVVVYDASRVTQVKTDRNGNLSGHGISVSILSAGERYDLNKRRVVKGSPALK
jgi:cyanophycinase